MKPYIWCGLLLALLAGHAWAADPNTPGTVPCLATGAATGNNLYPCQPMSLGAQGTGSTYNPPSGGSGILGYLSGIYKAVTGTLVTADQNGAAFSSAVTLTAGGSSDSVGRSVEMLVTVAGNVSLQLSSGNPHIISVAASPYTQTLPYAITAINSTGTTATATYANLH